MVKKSPGSTQVVNKNKGYQPPREDGEHYFKPFFNWERELNEVFLSALFLPYAVLLTLFTWDLISLLFVTLSSLFLATRTVRRGGEGKTLLHFVPLPILVFFFGVVLYPSTTPSIFTIRAGDYFVIKVGWDSVRYALINSLKFIAITLLIWGITFNPNGDVLFFCLGRVSKNLPIMLLSSFYLLPRIASDARTIIEVQKVRGILRSEGLMDTIRWRGRLLMPLLRDSFLRSEALADSILSRNLINLRTPPLPLKRSPVQTIVLATSGFLAVVIIPIVLDHTVEISSTLLGAVKGSLFLLYQFFMVGGGR